MDLSRAVWRTSSFSSANGGQCVEIAVNMPDGVAVRDSKNPDGPKLAFAPDKWQAFTDGVKAGEYDLR